MLTTYKWWNSLCSEQEINNRPTWQNNVDKTLSANNILQSYTKSPLTTASNKRVTQRPVSGSNIGQRQHQINTVCEWVNSLHFSLFSDLSFSFSFWMDSVWDKVRVNGPPEQLCKLVTKLIYCSAEPRGEGIRGSWGHIWKHKPQAACHIHHTMHLSATSGMHGGL